jgi:hypothetical protein
MERAGAVVFSSFVPHRSRPNTSDKSRRCLLLTFCRASHANDVGTGSALYSSMLQTSLERCPDLALYSPLYEEKPAEDGGGGRLAAMAREYKELFDAGDLVALRMFNERRRPANHERATAL